MTARIEPRTVPTQDRSRHTRTVILDAASTLLAEGGPDALTTSALAKRTSLPVRNVYRYFGNRQTVIATLAERMNERIESAVAAASAIADPARSLERAVDELIDGVIETASADPAANQIRSAMRTNRELQAIDAESDRRIARKLADSLQQRGIRARRARLETGLYVLITSIGAVLDRAALDSTDGDDTAMVREVKRMASAFLHTLE